MNIEHLKMKEKLNNDMIKHLNKDLEGLTKKTQIETIEKIAIEGTKKLIYIHHGKISIVDIQTMLEFLSQLVYADCFDYYDAKEFIDICEKTIKEFKKKLYRK